MKPLFLITLLVVSVITAGCSSNNDRALKPEPLKEIAGTLDLQFFWSANVGDGGNEQYLRLQQVVDEQAVYAADYQGIVTVFDKVNGKVLWTVNLEKPLSSGPTVANGMVVVATLDGEVVTLDIRDGHVIWVGQASSEILAAPLVAQGKVIVRSGDGRLYAFSEATGKFKWVFDRTAPGLVLRGTSRPLYAKNMIIAGFDTGRLALVNPSDGLPLNERVIGISQGRSEVERLSDIDSDPVVENDTLYIAAFQDRLFAIDLSTGRPLWEREISTYTPLTVANGNVYVINERHEVWAFSADNGSTRWRQTDLTGRRLTQATPVNDMVCMGDYEGYIHCLDAFSGEQRGRIDTGLGEIRSAPVFDGHLLVVMGESGRISALKP